MCMRCMCDTIYHSDVSRTQCMRGGTRRSARLSRSPRKTRARSDALHHALRRPPFAQSDCINRMNTAVAWERFRPSAFRKVSPPPSVGGYGLIAMPFGNSTPRSEGIEWRASRIRNGFRPPAQGCEERHSCAAPSGLCPKPISNPRLRSCLAALRWLVTDLWREGHTLWCSFRIESKVPYRLSA